MLGLTFLATIANTNQVLGQPGFAYQNGISYLFWTNAAALTIGAILLPRIGTRLRGMNLSTIVDLAQKRFPDSKRVHYLVLVWQAAWAVFLTALSLFGAALLIEVVTGLSWQANILIIAVVTIAYTVLGGLSAGGRHNRLGTVASYYLRYSDLYTPDLFTARSVLVVLRELPRSVGALYNGGGGGDEPVRGLHGHLHPAARTLLCAVPDRLHSGGLAVGADRPRFRAADAGGP